MMSGYQDKPSASAKPPTPKVFERFTDRARRVFVLAQEQAGMLKHNYIGTEHILLGLILEGESAAVAALESMRVALELVRMREPDHIGTEHVLLGLIHEVESAAAAALESLGVGPEGLRQQVGEIIGQGQQAPLGHIPFTPRAKKVLEQSLRVALRLNCDYIGTEHIMLGLTLEAKGVATHEGEGVATQALVKLGADLDRVYQQVLQQMMSGYQDKPSARAGQGKSSARAGRESRRRAGQESPDTSQIEQSKPPTLAQAVNRKLGKPPFKVDGGFYAARHIATGATFYTEVIIFLGQAALAGVVGNALYDGVRSTVQSIARRWQARRKLSDEDVAELICVAVRLRLRVEDEVFVVEEVLGDGLVVEEMTKRDDGMDARVRNLNSNERWHVLLRGVNKDWPIDEVTTVFVWCFWPPERPTERGRGKGGN